MKPVIITVASGGPGAIVPEQRLEDKGPLDSIIHVIHNRLNEYSPCQAYQSAVQYINDADILVYIHDDVTIHDPNWLCRLVWHFTCVTDCVALGFGGAPILGCKDLYRKKYDINNMARSGYMSNQTDWSTHGKYLAGPRRVAVLDAFFMAIRRDFLLDCGGWPVDHLTHHCLDLWLACEIARRGGETWAIPISCTHHGGGTSTKPSYASAPWLQGGTLESDHQIPHRWLWEEYRDVLPIEVH